VTILTLVALNVLFVPETDETLQFGCSPKTADVVGVGIPMADQWAATSACGKHFVRRIGGKRWPGRSWSHSRPSAFIRFWRLRGRDLATSEISREVELADSDKSRAQL